MTHLQSYYEAGKVLRAWMSENPPEGVVHNQIGSYKVDYSNLYLMVERELYQAYNEKEIDEKTYGEKCESLDKIDKEVRDVLSKKSETPPIPPQIDAILRMLGRDKGDGGGFIIFGGKFP
jgi:hypothetical protein